LSGRRAKSAIFGSVAVDTPYCVPMSSLVWLGLAVVLVVVSTLAGVDPKGGKPIARTKLMKAARSVLIAAAVTCGVVGLAGAILRRLAH
jgi:hypothetical protein